MQQLATLGRNEPCPCGSGRKFKKCCLDAHAAAVTADADLVALVDRAIATDDWDELHDHVDLALELFAPGEPLEHVRFRDDVLVSHTLHDSELSTVCTAGWLARCELELTRVLDRHALEPDERDSLRVALYLLRRFGAQSPLVEEVANLQAREQVARARRLATTQSALGITAADAQLPATPDLGDWIERERPQVLSFADWLALRIVPDEQLPALWSAGISSRVFDTCLDRLDDPASREPRLWAEMGSLALFGNAFDLGAILARLTTPCEPTVDEILAYQAVSGQADTGFGRIHHLIGVTESRGDFAGAALLREVLRMLQNPR